MSKFKKLVEKVLLEAKVFRLLGGNLRVLRNPSKNDYEQFKSNTTHNAVRGAVIDGNVYVCDAYDIIHMALVNNVAEEILDEEDGMLEDDERVNALFEDDEFGNLGIRYSGTKNLPNLERCVGGRESHSAHNQTNEKGFFRKETDHLYKYGSLIFDDSHEEEAEKAKARYTTREDWEKAMKYNQALVRRMPRELQRPEYWIAYFEDCPQDIRMYRIHFIDAVFEEIPKEFLTKEFFEQLVNRSELTYEDLTNDPRFKKL